MLNAISGKHFCIKIKIDSHSPPMRLTDTLKSTLPMLVLIDV